MKKIFINITHIVLAVMIITYLLINCAKVPVNGDINSSQLENAAVIAASANTGLPVIGFILFFPTVILSIVCLCVDNIKIAFARNVIALFASIFVLTATIITMVSYKLLNYYVPIILIICTAVILICSAYYIFKAIKEDDLNKKEENNSNDEKPEYYS